MKQTVESLVVLIGYIVVAEVINEICGYRMIDVRIDKNTIKHTK
jgi:hypothetical protein